MEKKFHDGHDKAIDLDFMTLISKDLSVFIKDNECEDPYFRATFVGSSFSVL